MEFETRRISSAPDAIAPDGSGNEEKTPDIRYLWERAKG